jgi:DNA-binding SARP family transcriptional activator
VSTPASNPETTLRLHGSPALLRSGAPAMALERRAAALCALVAVEGEVARSRAAAWLWPASDDPRGALRQKLLRFKRLFGTPLLDGAEALRLVAGIAI